MLGLLLSSAPPILGASTLGLGSMGWSVGMLEPVVAGYALRLYRNLGTRVGWWLVTTFVFLALAHLLQSWAGGAGFHGQTASLSYTAFLVPLLLLIGMAHTESMFADRGRLERRQQELQLQTESQAQGTIAALERERRNLQDRVAFCAAREKALEESAREHFLLFAHNPQPMLIFELGSLRILAANNAALAQYGFTPEELLTVTCRDILPEEEVAAFVNRAGQPAPVCQPPRRWRHRRKDGVMLQVESQEMDLQYGGCAARLIVAGEVGRQAETAFWEERRTELMRRVVSGLTRHFAGALGAIRTETERLLAAPQTPQSGESLKRISSAASWAAGVTRQLSMAVGCQRVELASLDLNDFLLQLEPVLRRLVGPAIHLETAFAPEQPHFLGDRRLLEHIVLNLSRNARDAMPAGGTLSLRTSAVCLVEADHAVGNAQEQFACLTVRDTGCGVKPEARAHLFEPFFTTRDASHALGLGLASASGAAKQLGGWIELATEPSVGTEFRVLFPWCLAPRPAAEPVRKPAATRTVLLVEPEDRMRMMTRAVLERKGFKVVETDSASLALTVWPHPAGEVDLLLTDLALPGPVSGRELAERLQKQKPALKVLFTCGASVPASGVARPKEPGSISKPFTPAELLQRVSEALPDNS